MDEADGVVAGVGSSDALVDEIDAAGTGVVDTAVVVELGCCTAVVYVVVFGLATIAGGGWLTAKASEAAEAAGLG